MSSDLFQRVFCPNCRSFLLEVSGDSVVLRIKCRKCTRNSNAPVFVVIELEIATEGIPVVDSESSRPIERVRTPP